LANTLGGTVGQILFGRLGDIFGRRWLWIGSNIIVLIGSIVAATAGSIPAMIVANALIGFGAAAQLAYAATLGELLPYKARGFVSAIVFISALPTNAFGPIVAKSFIAHTVQTWRWCYYLNIITTAIAIVAAFFFYHPPTFAMLHVNKSKWQQVKSLDYGGLVLLLGGLVIFLLGLNWGGSLYPWASGHVIATLVVGLLSLVGFVVYEFTVPVDPIIPPTLMKNRQVVLIIGVACVGGMIFYGMSIVWPAMVATLFTSDLIHQGWLTMSCTAGAALGNIVAGACFRLGKFRWQLTFASVMVTIFFGAMASVNQHTLARGVAFTVLGTFFAGWLESPTMTAVSLAVDQSDIGLVVGMLNTIRVCFGSIAVAIYETILTNRDASLSARYIPHDAMAAGLPSSSLTALGVALTNGTTSAPSRVPGMNPVIESAIAVAQGKAYAGAANLVFLVTMAFGVLAVIGSLFVGNFDTYLTNEVSRRIHSTPDRKVTPPLGSSSEGHVEKV